MHINSRFINEKTFRDIFSKSELKDFNFSFFFDCVPSFEELSINPINIYVHEEPNEYFGHHDWIIQNQQYFSVILTWSDKVLNNCSNAMFLPFGSTWLKPEQYEKQYPKEFHVSHVRGNLHKTYGHSLRFEYHDRSQKELKIPYKSWETAGIREIEETCAAAKCELFGGAQFGVCIENTSHRGYFTEKIMEMFLLKTIPVYWGCSNITDFFNPEGIITFTSIDDAIYKLNTLDKSYYNDRLEVINENYNKALQYVNYEQRICNNLIEIFKLNNLI
jgi:hypothetical protein